MGKVPETRISRLRKVIKVYLVLKVALDSVTLRSDHLFPPYLDYTVPRLGPDREDCPHLEEKTPSF